MPPLGRELSATAARAGGSGERRSRRGEGPAAGDRISPEPLELGDAGVGANKQFEV